MDGFLQGVEYYNEENGDDVEVIGWDGKDGSFTEDFEDQAKGQQVAEQMIEQGADIIFPVAGPAGLGGLKAAQDDDAWGIWVDTDGCESAAEYCDILLTSVVKGMDVAVRAGDRGLGRRRVHQRGLPRHARERRRRPRRLPRVRRRRLRRSSTDKVEELTQRSSTGRSRSADPADARRPRAGAGSLPLRLVPCLAS